MFLSNRTCTVHEAKPIQCRAYPFLPLDGFTPVESAFTWRYEKKFCPGIGKGRLYSKREILTISRGRGSVQGFACQSEEARRKRCDHQPGAGQRPGIRMPERGSEA